MAVLTQQFVSDSGAALTYVAASVGGDTAPYDPYGFIHVVNGSGVSINVTLQPTGQIHGQAKPAVVVAVPAGANRLIKTGSDEVTPGSGIAITYSAVTTVTVAAITTQPQ